jgi:CRP-like cAMP-binding protein
MKREAMPSRAYGREHPSFGRPAQRVCCRDESLPGVEDATAMDQKATMLSKCQIFAGLSARDLAEVGRLADEVDVPSGKVVAKEGAAGHEFFVILDGKVDITKGGKLVNTMGPGDFFGELAMLGKVPRSATVTAAAPTRLLVVGHREFTSLLTSHPAIRDKVLKAVASWISDLSPSRPA